MKISKELYTFFKEWLEDAESEHPCQWVRNYGLCATVHVSYPDVSEELSSILREVCNKVTYPFSCGKEYAERRVNGTQHLCPKRLAFVREQIALYESYVENE